MKKSTISLSLLLLVGASCLTSCNKAAVKPMKENGKSVLFTIGNDQHFYADDLLNSDQSNFDFLESEEGLKLLYSEIEKAIVKDTVKETENIKNAVDIKMDEWKEQVKSFAAENGLTERLAEQSMLTEKGFETREELKASYIYEEQKSQYIKDFQSNHLQPKIKEGKYDQDAFNSDTSLLKDYVINTNPMIMKHVLVKISSTDNVFNQAEITPEESDKLGTVVKRLAVSNTPLDTDPKKASEQIAKQFTEVAMSLSEDEGSGAKGGNLGIVDEYTAFVDEFKYGVYSSLAYTAKDSSTINEDAKFKTSEDIIKALDLDKNDFDANYSQIGEIEVKDAYDILVNQKDETKQEDDKEVVNKYPRNIEFNKHFNSKTAQYLKVTDKDATAKLLGCNAKDLKVKPFNINGKTSNYVVDENGQPIVVVRSEYGIHFISVTYNSLAHSDLDNIKYFITDKFLANNENGYYQNKFFNIGHKQESENTSEKNRKKEIEDRILNYIKGGFGASVTPSDELLNYYIFKQTFNTDEFKLTGPLGESVTKNINAFVDNKFAVSTTKITNARNGAIEDYGLKIGADLAAHKDLYGKGGAN